jgi:hypothetical protein
MLACRGSWRRATSPPEWAGPVGAAAQATRSRQQSCCKAASRAGPGLDGCCRSTVGGTADRRLASRWRTSAGLLQPDAADHERPGWSDGDRSVGDDRGVVRCRELPGRRRPRPNQGRSAGSPAADTGGPIDHRGCRFAGRCQRPDAVAPGFRSVLHSHDAGLAALRGVPRARPAVGPWRVLRLDCDRPIRRAVGLAADQHSGQRRPGPGRAPDLLGAGIVASCRRPRALAGRGAFTHSPGQRPTAGSRHRLSAVPTAQRSA